MSDEHPTGYVDLTTPDPVPTAPTEEAPVDLPPTEATDAVPTPEAPAPAPAPTKAAAFNMGTLPDLRETLQADSAENKSRAEFTTVYDVIDRLESMLDEAKTSMFSPGTVKVDRDEFTSQLAELKKLLPVQLRSRAPPGIRTDTGQRRRRIRPEPRRGYGQGSQRTGSIPGRTGKRH